MATIPNPQNLSWQQWATTVAGFNPTFSQYVTPTMDWTDYGRTLTYLEPQVPRVEMYDDWQEWARALKLAISS